MELFGAIFGTTAVDRATGDGAWLQALCATEAALARACATAGLIAADDAAAVAAAAADLATGETARLGSAAAAGGNPVIPLVAALRDRVGSERAAAVHLGATSQDILDTALMLITRQALAVIRDDLGACADAAAALARAHRATRLAGRTLLQPAQPTTFGALAAGWGAGLDRGAARLAAVDAGLPVQLSGPVGTLAGWHPHGFAVVAAFADQLGLAVPDGVWATDRTRIAELAGALGMAAAAVAKVATDVVLLSQAELGEVAEAAPGGSSSMPHKRNSIAAVTARAGAAQVPGLVATVLAAGSHELQRGAGPWHAEWPALIALLRASGGAVDRLRASLTGLRVNEAAMAANLSRVENSPADARPAADHAADLVDQYLARRAR